MSELLTGTCFTVIEPAQIINILNVTDHDLWTRGFERNT